ncbi:acyl-CoA dehydrogenase [Streptomyces sp. ITFR-16]|uniref:acyl-CoA dehydrogenase family protein n=1 Tax=Streptomyces sp. ITFR-16 TaxID=3075198 RepID=UPI00288AB851|nr:acyl-CoA dehydrogenase [Streptomyces sp. ITFR-16]WNI21461.1 acyl-CoA dehydrogenase [Streptomyces sp. ITFR-16]
MLRSTVGVDRSCVTDPRRYFALEEWAAVVDPSLAALLAAHLNLCLGSLLQLGSSREADQALGDLEAGRATGAFLATEAVWGSDLARLRTEAHYDSQRREFVLNTPDDGAVKFMSNNALRELPKIAVVLARLRSGPQDHGVHAFVCHLGTVDEPAPGVRVTPLPDKPGMPTDNALTRFRDARVPLGALLDGDGHIRDALRAGEILPIDRPAAFARSVARVGIGKVGLSAVSAAMARAAVTIATRFAEHRHSAGAGAARVPLIEHRVHYSALIDATADVYTASYVASAGMATAVRAAARRHVVPTPAEAHRYTMTKYLVTSLCHQVLTAVQGLCGAHGMFAVNRIPLYLAVNRGCMTAEGDNTVIALAAAREMVHRHDEAALRSPTAHPLPPEGDLPAWAALAAAREEQALRACHRGLAAARRTHTQILDVWNTCSARFLRLADRHAHRIALDELLAAQQQTDDAEARKLIACLGEVHALRDLRRDAAATLRDGLIAPEHLVLLDHRTDRCRDQLHTHLPILVDAFGIPHPLLDVPAASPSFVQDYLHTHYLHTHRSRHGH